MHEGQRNGDVVSVPVRLHVAVPQDFSHFSHFGNQSTDLCTSPVIYTMTALVSNWLPKQALPVLLSLTPQIHVLQRKSLSPEIRLLRCDAKFYSSTPPYTSKASTSFFTYNSGRARRKRKLRLLLSRKEKKQDEEIVNIADSENSSIDNRTVMDILFPNPFKGMPLPEQPKWPTTYTKWKEILSLAWRDYKETWVGFTTSKGILVQDQNDEEQQKLEQKRKVTIDSKKNEVLRNMKRNRRFLQVSAMKIREEVRTRTGITSMEDVKRYAADAMRLATECLQQFMSGYRKGRDDEVENMLTQYFQQLEQKAIQQAEKKPRRKIKRRIVNRYHPMKQE